MDEPARKIVEAVLSKVRVMPPARTYSTAGAFRTALEARLKKTSLTDQTDLNRLRRQVSFDRLLARLFQEEQPPWALKGGYALELRFKAARSTVDIDLTLQRSIINSSATADTNEIMREMLQSAAGIELGDWYEYLVGPPVMDLTAAPYGGARYPIEVQMNARVFSRFHLDAGIGDVVMQPLDTIICRDWLSFAGIETSWVRMIPREQQFAKKIHAYTLPRTSANSRVKDLVDLLLLIRSDGMDQQRILAALRLTFERRASHELPETLVPPPDAWQVPFQSLAEECSLAKLICPPGLPRSNAISKCCWDFAPAGESVMTESGSGSLAFESTEQENIRLREENARIRRLLAVHGIPLPQPAPEISSSAILANATPPVDKQERARKRIALFRSLFRGREDVYARRWGKEGRGSGYSPAALTDWTAINKSRPENRQKVNRQTRKFIPFADSVIESHLLGRDTVGIYPLLRDETCWFLAVDFDKKTWEYDSQAFLETCRELGVPAALERSRSGKGGHVWIFFDRVLPAITARKLGCAILTRTMERRHQLGLDSYDRFFPNQDTMPKGGLGNLIALPLQFAPRKNGNSLFIDGDFQAYPDQWRFLSTIRRMPGDVAEKIVGEAQSKGDLIGVRISVAEDEGQTGPVDHLSFWKTEREANRRSLSKERPHRSRESHLCREGTSTTGDTESFASDCRVSESRVL